MNAQERIDITSQHRNRLAVVYSRQATPSQIPHQLHPQALHGLGWGWPRGAIQVIEDTGQTPSGFRRLRRMIAAGRVGVVLVSRLTRLTRSPRVLLALLRLCHKSDTLVAVDGVLVSSPTMALEESDPTPLAHNGGRAASQPIQEFYRELAEAKEFDEMVAAVNKRRGKRTPAGSGQ